MHGMIRFKFFKQVCMALAGWLSWLEHHPIHQKAAGLIPQQGSYLGCRSHQGGVGVDGCSSLTWVFLSLSLSRSLSLSLSPSSSSLSKISKPVLS